MTEEQMWENVGATWQKVIDCLVGALDVAIENCDYKDAILFAIAIEKCYNARFGNREDFTGIELP